MKRKTFSHWLLLIFIACPLLFSVPVNGYADGWKAISAGGRHTIAIKSDGSLWAWGYNGSGQLGTGSTTTRTIPTPIGKDSDWIAVSAGSSHSVALRSNGTLWAWGNNADGQLGTGSTTTRTIPTSIGRDSDWIAVSAGGYHTVAVKTDGTLWAWGYGVTIPTQIGTGTNWTAISAGSNHAVALSSGGTLWAWGYNDYGQLGDGTTTARTLPVQIGSDSNWTVISAGGYRTIALKADGTLWAWGQNNYSQLGDDTTTQRNSPIQIGSDYKWTAVSAGASHSTAVKSDGTLWVWGNNTNGQLGIDSTTIKTIPYLIKLSRVVAVSAGGVHTLAVLSEGTLLAWGDNYYGQLGNGDTRDQLTPDQIGSSVISADASKIDGGSNHTIILKSNGTLWAMGYNGYGQLGDDTTGNKSRPAQIGTESRWASIAAGYYHTVGLKAYGTLWSWGRNNYGQLGDGTATTTPTTLPTQIGTDNKWVAVSAGAYHTVALKADGTLWAWGYNYYGQLGDGTTTQQPSPIQIGTDNKWVAVSAGAYHTVALKADGTLWAWGYNYYGQLGDGTTTNKTIPTKIGTGRTWISITAGTYHTIALKADGTLWAWGYNYYGQLGDGTTTNKTIPTQIGTDYKWTAISVGGYHTTALKSTGTLWAWGYNYYGQLGDGSTTQQTSPTQIGTDDNWVAVSTGPSHSIAIKADGTLWTWGLNNYGQLGDGTAINGSVPIQCDITSPTGSISINGGNGYTNSASVALTLSAYDENGVSQMSFSNDNVTWSDPETYSASRSWPLSSGDGTKIVYVKFKDARENWSTALYDTIVLDTTPPAGVTAGVNETRNAEFTQTGTATDASGMTYSWSKQAGPGTITFGTPNTLSTNIAVSLDGTYTIRFTATDTAGNSSSGDMTLVWDTTPPIGVSAGVNQAKKAQFIQTGAAVDANDMTYSWTQQAGPGTITFGTPNAISTTISASLDGTFTIRFTATDIAGNSSYNDATLVWDTAAPTAGIGAPSTTISNSGPVTYAVTYTGADTISLANANVTLNKTGTANATVNVSGTGNMTRTVTISGITGDGTLGISIAAGTSRDVAGNLAGPAGPSTTFTVDNVPPTTTANPKSGTFNSTQNVSLTTTESATIYYTTDGNDPSISSSIYNIASPISIAATTTLKFRALDPAGNLEPVKTETYTIAQVGPAGSVSGPERTNTPQVTLNLTTANATNNTLMCFSFDNLFWSGFESFKSQKTLTLTGGDGVKTIYVQFKDVVSDIASNAYTYTTILDTTKPTGSVTIAGGALGTTSQTISLTLGASDSTSGVQQVGLSNDGQNYTWGNYLPGQPMNWILTAGEGQKTIYIKFRDGAGNESDPYSVQITFDTVKPVPVISSPVNGSSVTSLNFIKGSVTDASPSSGIAKIEIRLTDGSQFIKANGDWTTTDSFFTLTPGEINGNDWNHTTLFLDWVLDKTYTITVRATDYAGNSADTTSAVTFIAPEKAYTTLSLWPTSQTIIGGGTLDVSGTLDRPGAIINLKDRPIKLTITDPNGIVDRTLNTTTYDTAGHYEIKGISGFDKKGAWTLTASFDGSASLDAAQSTKTVLVGNTAGYAILIQGKIDDIDTDGIASHNKTTNRIYKKLRERGFDAANIRYFNYDTNQEGVYNTPTIGDKTNGANPQGIENSIKLWAKDRINSAPAPLYIIMVNHGNPGTFHLGSVEKITPTDIASWLNDLESNLNAEALKEKRVVIIGACYSGSFISELSNPSTSGAPNRIVIASAADDEESYRGANEPDGIRSGEYFLEELFIQLGRGYSLKKSFDDASQKTGEYTRKGGTHANTTNKYFDHSVQHPLLEDDGNRIGSNKLSEGQRDGVTAANLFFGAGATYTNSANNTAEIVKVTDTVYLDADPSHIAASLTLQTNVDTYGVDNAWVEIRSPNKTLTPSGSGSMQLVIDLAKAPMTSTDPNGHWAVAYNGFTESGMYDVLYFVRDKETGKISPMKRSVVYKDRSGNTAPCGTTGCPSQLHLLSPASNSTQKTTLVFTWGGAVDSDGVSYNLVIAEDINFTKVVYRKEGIAATMTYVDNAAGLKDSMTYYWMIEAVDGFGEKTISYEKWPFKTDNTNGYPGIITGIVYSDRDFSMITSATITAMINGNAIPIEVKDGLFILSANAAAIDITGTSSGYQTTALADIPVRVGEATVVNLSLSPTAIQITATAGQNGTISCTPNPVDYGSSSTCTVTPEAGYQVDAFTVEGSPATLTNSQYVFRNVTADLTVNVTFKPAVASDDTGDMNDDGSVDIADAILALKVITRITTTGTVHKEANVNGDGKIGLPEVIYILQKAAGLR